MTDKQPHSGTLGPEIRRFRAHQDADTVIVYQAYPPALAEEVASSGALGGRWRTDRHTRIQPSWVWAMERYDWGQRPDRERIFALSIRRTGLDAMLAAAVCAQFDSALYASREAWHLATRYAPVLVSWEAPPKGAGGPVPRLTVHGPLVERLAREWVVSVTEVTAEARSGAVARAAREAGLHLDAETAARIGCSPDD